MRFSRLFWKLVIACTVTNLAVAGTAALLSVYGRTWEVALAVVVGTGSLVTWLTIQIIQPVRSIASSAEAIAAGSSGHRVHLIARDELGVLARAVNQIQAELARRGAQLATFDDRQLTVLDAMVEGVIAVDAAQRILLANPAAGRLFDFRPAAVAGRQLLELVRNHALSSCVNRAITDGEFQDIELTIPGSSSFSFDVHVQPIPGTPVAGAVIVLHDVTALRRLESLRRDFIANVSHELKTPLSSIKAYAETLRNGAVNDHEMRVRFLSRIDEQSDRLHYLITDMLSLARIESDHREYEVVSLEVAEVARECVDAHRHAAAAKRIEFTIEAEACGNGSGDRVRADREGLRQILDNLLDNAVKYTPEGGRVSLRWQTNGGMMHIRVQDTGVGIKSQDQHRVFERFYRVDKARSRELGGTGLGLAIVKHLAHAFDGTVSVESEPGKGSTFTISLPSK